MWGWPLGLIPVSAMGMAETRLLTAPSLRSPSRAAEHALELSRKKNWCAWQDSNLRPLASEANALSRLSYRRADAVGASGQLEPSYATSPFYRSGAGRGDTGRLALSSVGRESSSVLRTGIQPRCGSRPPCVLAVHPVSPLLESCSPACGATRAL